MIAMRVIMTHSAASVVDIEARKRTDVATKVCTRRAYDGSRRTEMGTVLQFNGGTNGGGGTNAPGSDGTSDRGTVRSDIGHWGQLTAESNARSTGRKAGPHSGRPV